ncbi:hypothetical protein D3C78_1478690 [compost metagenome]
MTPMCPSISTRSPMPTGRPLARTRTHPSAIGRSNAKISPGARVFKVPIAIDRSPKSNVKRTGISSTSNSDDISVPSDCCPSASPASPAFRFRSSSSLSSTTACDCASCVSSSTGVSTSVSTSLLQVLVTTSFPCSSRTRSPQAVSRVNQSSPCASM